MEVHFRVSILGNGTLRLSSEVALVTRAVGGLLGMTLAVRWASKRICLMLGT